MGPHAIKSLGVDLELRELILPANLLSAEQVSQEDLEEEPGLDPYRVTTTCASCSARLVFCVVSSSDTVRDLHSLFLRDLSLLCARCAKNTSRNGR